MSRFKKLSHVIYRCTYHIVWTPKYRFRILEGIVKELLSNDIQMLLEWKSCELIELNIQLDHIHLIVSIPPKMSVSQLMGILKGKTAIKIFKSYPQLKKKPYWGNHFWAREALKQKQLFAVKLNSYQTMKRLSEADSLRLKLGSIMEIDAIQSKLEAGSLFNELLQAEADLRNSFIQLSQMTRTLKEDTVWVPEGSLIFKQRLFVLSNLIDIARNKRADLVAALYNKDVAHKALRLAQKERNIDLGLSMGVNNSYTSAGIGPTATTVSAGIAIPLKFSNYYKGELKQAQFQISQSEVLYEKADLQIRTEIAQAMQKYQALCKQVDSFDHGMLESAQNVRKGKIYSYNRGETSLLEVLNAQRTYNDIQLSYYETLFNRAVALVELEKAAGIWDISF